MDQRASIKWVLLEQTQQYVRIIFEYSVEIPKQGQLALIRKWFKVYAHIFVASIDPWRKQILSQ